MNAPLTYSSGVPLRDLTTYKVGGPADQLYTPHSLQELVDIAAFLRENHSEFFILGGGSNLLIADDGLRQPVILMTQCLREIECREMSIRAGASLRLAELVDFTLEKGFLGLQNLAGIPGTLGGALKMNAGAYGAEISDCLTSVDVLNSQGIVETISATSIGFAYRQSPGLEGKLILGAEFQFQNRDPVFVRDQARKILEMRKARQPLEFPSAGSVFKKHPEGPAGLFIEKAGLKGAAFGDAQISLKHANFIVNRGNARAIEILALINLAQNSVRRIFSLELELEQKLLGFTQEQLDNPQKFL